MAHIGVTYRLDPTPQQGSQMFAFAAACRAVWNAAIEQRETAWRRQRERVGFAQQCRDISPARKELPFLAKAPVNALHAALRDLDRAYRNWWTGNARRPNFKSAKRTAPSFRVKGDDSYIVESGRHVMLPKIGVVRARLSRLLPGRIMSATVSHRFGHWFISYGCEVAEPSPAVHQGEAIGIDVGVANTLTLSNGDRLSMACPTQRDWQRLARLQRRVARRVPGSRGSRKARLAVSRWYEFHANRRNDFIAKSVNDLTRRFSLIAVEDLAVDRMTRRTRGRGRAAKAGLNRAMLLRAFGTFRTRIEQKAPWTGTQIIVVDPRHTSQTCHQCGHIARKNRESQAVFRCVECGHEAHADVNAALNILSRAGHARIDAGGVSGLERLTMNSEPYMTSTEASYVR